MCSCHYGKAPHVQVNVYGLLKAGYCLYSIILPVAVGSSYVVGGGFVLVSSLNKVF